MARPDDHPALFPQAVHPPDLIQINARGLLQTGDGHHVVSVSGIVMAQDAVGDRRSEAYAMVSLVEQGHADHNDVARAFARSPRTARRYQVHFATGGLPALAQTVGYPKGRRRLPESRDRLVNRLTSAGRSNGDISRRCGVSENAIRKQLKRLGWREKTPAQATLPLTGGSHPNLSALTTALVENIPRAGVVLAIPALTSTGVFDCANTVFGDIGPAF